MSVYNLERPDNDNNCFFYNIKEKDIAYYDDISNAFTSTIYLNMVITDNLNATRRAVKDVLRQNGFIIAEISPAYKGENSFIQQQFKLLYAEDY